MSLKGKAFLNLSFSFSQFLLSSGLTSVQILLREIVQGINDPSVLDSLKDFLAGFDDQSNRV